MKTKPTKTKQNQPVGYHPPSPTSRMKQARATRLRRLATTRKKLRAIVLRATPAPRLKCTRHVTQGRGAALRGAPPDAQKKQWHFFSFLFLFFSSAGKNHRQPTEPTRAPKETKLSTNLITTRQHSPIDQQQTRCRLETDIKHAPDGFIDLIARAYLDHSAAYVSEKASLTAVTARAFVFNAIASEIDRSIYATQIYAQIRRIDLAQQAALRPAIADAMLEIILSAEI